MFDFPKFINTCLSEKSLTQGGLAKELGVSRRLIVLWLAGEGDPGDEACYALERLMGLPAQTLILHKQLNRIEALGLALPKMIEPDMLKHHGIIPVAYKPTSRARHVAFQDSAPHNPDAAHAAELAEAGRWTDLAQWALGKLSNTK